jgi:oligopeptide/dipeptide ABC transporter ATP-binding protein
MTALSIMRLLPKGSARTVAGQVLLAGDDLLRKTPREMREIRGGRISMILQDPQTSLNPVFSIGDQLREAIFRRTHAARRDVMREAVAALRHVDIAAPEQRIAQYPHQLSGGMKQRVVGAIAMSGHPEVLIADEPTTALDVTIQLQYLKLLKRLQQESNMAILFITHDFGVVARMCDRVAVMYAGQIVECGPVREVFENPSHPYTQALIASVPQLSGTTGRLRTIDGQPPSMLDLPRGCRFAPRCKYAMPRCRDTYPDSFDVGVAHTADCWRLAPA